MQLYLESFIIIQIFEFFLFLLALRLKRNDLADVGWGLGFGLLALFAYLKNTSPVFFQKILLLLILLWSVRLAGYLGWRMSGKAEDQRYVDLREGWGKNWILNSYLKVFVLQGALLSLLATPLLFHLSNLNPLLNHFTWLSLGLGFFGLIYETVADAQKSIFKKGQPPSGSFIQTGLFKYSRYPQYFGEIIFWSGIALFQFSWGLHLGLIIFPVLLTYLLLYFSGIPLLEKNYLKRKGYQEYAASTPKLWPRFFKIRF